MSNKAKGSALHQPDHFLRPPKPSARLRKPRPDLDGGFRNGNEECLSTACILFLAFALFFTGLIYQLKTFIS